MKGSIGKGAIAFVQNGRITGYGFGYEDLNGRRWQDRLLYEDHTGYPAGSEINGGAEHSTWRQQHPDYSIGDWQTAIRRTHTRDLACGQPFGAGLVHEGKRHTYVRGEVKLVDKHSTSGPDADAFDTGPFWIFSVKALGDEGQPTEETIGYVWAAHAAGRFFEAWTLDEILRPPQSVGFQLAAVEAVTSWNDARSALDELSGDGWTSSQVTLRKTALP